MKWNGPAGSQSAPNGRGESCRRAIRRLVQEGFVCVMLMSSSLKPEAQSVSAPAPSIRTAAAASRTMSKKEEKPGEEKAEPESNWKHLIYNPNTGEFVGRTASSWGKREKSIYKSLQQHNIINFMHATRLVLLESVWK